jgi:rhamnogalacturonyl hydrolase YesR
MRPTRLFPLAFCLLLCGSAAPALAFDPPPQEPVPPKLFPGPVQPVRDPAWIKALTERVADWQLAWPDERRGTHWTRAVGYTGIMAASRVTGNPRYDAAMLAMGEGNQWLLGPPLYHADDHIVGQTYLELYARHRDPRMIVPLRASFDKILTAPKETSFDHTKPDRSERWTWCDALFMAPPVWAGLAAATGEKAYLDFMVREWIAADDFLYDVKERLYFRDSRFFDLKEKNGTKIFWSRGNGWVLGAFARVLPLIPKEHPARARLVARFREFAARVVELQPADGLWRVSMLDTERYVVGETSGSALFCYGLAWGINAGLLDAATFAPATLRSWDALAAHVQPDGMLIRAQPVGHRPFRFDPDTTEVYASGSFLLAAEQILELVRKTENPR